MLFLILSVCINLISFQACSQGKIETVESNSPSNFSHLQPFPDNDEISAHPANLSYGLPSIQNNFDKDIFQTAGSYLYEKSTGVLVKIIDWIMDRLFPNRFLFCR